MKTQSSKIPCEPGLDGRTAVDEALPDETFGPPFRSGFDHGLFARIFGLVTALWLLFEITSQTTADPEHDLDHVVVAMLRSADDPARMIGSQALEEIMRDFTALGGYAVLSVCIIAFSVFLGIQSGRLYARFFMWLTVGGYCCSMLMKKLVGRDRPAIVPHLSHVATSSFPSTHAMMSLIVFLAMGILLARLTSDPRLRRLLIVVPCALAALVGISRVCMGVHFPTDVLAGWAAGILWTWAAFAVLERRLSGLRM